MSNIKLFNLAQTFHSLPNFKNKQVAKHLKSLTKKKQKIGATIRFPEGLENTPFTTELIHITDHIPTLT